jgi:hypothetical protein
MLRIDALWLCAQPVDMRAGTERLLAAVVTTLGEARAHHGLPVRQRPATRVKAAGSRRLRHLVRCQTAARRTLRLGSRRSCRSRTKE